MKGTGEISLSRELHHIRKLHLLFYILYNYCNFHKSYTDRIRKFIGQLVRRYWKTSSKFTKLRKVSIFHLPSTSFLPLNQFGDFLRYQIERPLFLSLHLLPSFFHMELLTSLKAQSELDTYIIVQYSLVQYITDRKVGR